MQKVLYAKHVAGAGGGWCSSGGGGGGGGGGGVGGGGAEAAAAIAGAAASGKAGSAAAAAAGAAAELRVQGEHAGPAGVVVRSERSGVFHLVGQEAARCGAWPIIGPAASAAAAAEAAASAAASSLREVACAPICNAGGGVIGALVVARVASQEEEGRLLHGSSGSGSGPPGSGGSGVALSAEHLAALCRVATAVGEELVERIDVTADSAYSRDAIVRKVHAALDGGGGGGGGDSRSTDC